MNNLKSYLFSLFMGTLIALTVWLSIFLTVNPNSTDIITKAAFFASLFLALTGIFTFISIYIMSHISKGAASTLVTKSLIQGSILSLVIVFSLILTTLNVFNLWEAIIIALLFIISEIYILSKSRI